LKSLSMTGFRIGPLDTDPKYKGQYRVSGKEDELKKILPANYHRETVFVKKVSLCETLSRNRRELDSVVALRSLKNTARTSFIGNLRSAEISLSQKVMRARTRT
jgi:hypothetical protein